jgi:Asp-tRNA(Asn)/Glu-tRNA(Gln) amidotransferase B subunit
VEDRGVGDEVKEEADRGGPELTAEEHRALREAAAPERPPALEARRRRFADELGVDAEDAELLTRETATADFFEAALAATVSPQRLANWMVNELPRGIGDRSLENLPFEGLYLGELVSLVEDGSLSSSAARDVLATMAETGEAPGDIVDREGLRQISDAEALADVVDQVLEADPAKVEAYRSGRTGLLGFFMGQVMKETNGKANPELAKELLEKRLNER